MLFEIFTDREIGELNERAIRQGNLYAANLRRREAEDKRDEIEAAQLRVSWGELP